ncbi:MAG: allophanate hydrolase [Thiobacillus sp. 63-78]|uniref:5-oxoprolinase subunit C family protein n=1 Tax=Thiobacillus sp. 63-78 TaxID=1895859 RepID=UPI00095B1CD2|nr:biotin-dependent carboxyltransferase family protein [Thiobacillus sp. 63-78]MBN8763851.1 biotin-dependent carboxyltransferase family protein [Thiobacillus sp.]MBN8772680.1 biotin-dependent carboxyltransferase family protein [Thiobacillus sp.]OJZ15555.1 MAG: allophanate hydrolase [Thiobacillus sp. 63-78]
MIEILRAGLCDMVMDFGRPGRGALGVPAGGAADRQALAAANRLVGNDEGAAGLEITLAGPRLRFPQGGVVALTGACFAARRSSGAAVAWNETLMLAAGEILALEHAVAGCRGWLAVRGGIAVPRVMGSRSTFLPSGMGGYAGRALQTGDLLRCGRAAKETHLLRATPPAETGNGLRVVAGPQINQFDDDGLKAFFGSAYRVGLASDRRGLRLSGAPVTHHETALSSQGVLPGSIQIPPDGQPIILGWDGPVTGGYPVIAGVITADMSRLAQLRPNDTIRFVTIEIEAARALAAKSWEIRELA